jgi:hypothetical protein
MKNFKEKMNIKGADSDDNELDDSFDIKTSIIVAVYKRAIDSHENIRFPFFSLIFTIGATIQTASSRFPTLLVGWFFAGKMM